MCCAIEMTSLAPTLIWCEKALLADGWAKDVLLEIDAAGDFTRVSPDSSAGDAARVAGAVLPGIGNLHSHAFQRAAAGLTERRHSADGPGGGNADSFWTWREVLHSFVTRLNPDDQEAIAAQLYVEMLKAGYTAVGEFHYVHQDPDGRPYADPAEMAVRTLAAAKTAGIGITMLPVLYTVGGYGDVTPSAGQKRYILDVDAFLALVQGLTATTQGDPNVRVGIAPHSVRQVPASPLAEALAGFDAIDATAPIHIHIAEQVRDVDEHLNHVGARPVEWLLANAEVDARWCLVHATHVNEAETRNMAASRAVAGICPTTEGNLGDGIFPFVDYLAAGGRWGIGSDSHVSVSPIEELRWLEYVQRLITRSRNVAAPGHGGSTGARLFGDALAGGAQALGRPIGALKAGCRADLVVLDTNHPNLLGRDGDGLLDSFIFGGNTNPVRDVMVGGRWVVRDGSHAAEDVVFATYRRTMRRLADESL